MTTFSIRRQVGLAVGALLIFGAAASAQTVISSVPYTITVSGKYVLGDNLLLSSLDQPCITINAPNVILDLNGFFVSGPAGSTGSPQDVIRVQNVSNVTIRNGTLANNGRGIFFLGGANASNYLVERVNITRCYLEGIRFGSEAPGSLVRNNSFSDLGRATGTPTAFPYAIFSQGGVSIENNLISTVTRTGNGTSYGIYSAGSDFAVENKISDCMVGIRMDATGKFLNNLTANCATPFVGGINATGNN